MNWFAYAAISIVPVLFISYVCCYYEQAELLLGLFLIEWIVILAAWKMLCPWLGNKSVALAVVPFLLSFCVAAVLLYESITTFNAVWTWSDDWRYLSLSEDVVTSLQSSGWNFLETWIELISIESGQWSLSGWPFILGTVASFVTSDPPPEMLHAIALSLNATFLSLVLTLFFHLLNERAQRVPWTVLICFILLIGDPIVYAAMSLKESMLQLSLMLAFVFCMKWPERFRVRWLILGLLGMAGVATSRPVYIPLILILLYWRVLDRIRLGMFIKVAIGLIIIASFGGLILKFQLRETTVEDRLAVNTLKGEPGLAMSVYNMPVLGPPLFYAISPVPPLPWKLLSQEQLATTLIRSVGSVAWLLSLCYVLRGIFTHRLLLKDKLFFAAAIMLTGLFIAAVISGDDPRYKQPTNFYLALMLFLTWYYSQIRRDNLDVPKTNSPKRNSMDSN